MATVRRMYTRRWLKEIYRRSGWFRSAAAIRGESTPGARRVIRRDLLVALGGIGGGHLLLLIAMPFLARAFGPSSFGTFAVVVSIAGIIATVAALRFDLAVVSAADEDVNALTRSSFLLPIFVVPLALTVLAFGLALPWGSAMPFDLNELLLIGPIALFQGLALVGMALGTRLGAFPTVAAMKILQPTAFALTALLVIKELSLAMAVGWAVACLVAIRLVWRVPFLRGWRSSWRITKRLWRFPAISMPMALLDALALALPLLVIASSYGDEAAGNYSQVQRLLGAPLALVAMAGSQVFMKYAGDHFRAAEPVTPLIRRFAFAMGGLASGVLIAVILIGDPLLQLLIGNEWRTDTGFLLLALLPVIFRVIASPVSSVLILTHRLSLLGAWQSSYFVTTAATLFLASRWLDFEGLLMALVVNELVLYGIYLALSVRAARHPVGPVTPTL